MPFVCKRARLDELWDFFRRHQTHRINLSLSLHTMLPTDVFDFLPGSQKVSSIEQQNRQLFPTDINLQRRVATTNHHLQHDQEEYDAVR